MIIYLAYIMLVFLLFVILGACLRRYLFENNKFKATTAKGVPTMFDVRQLLMEGKKEIAIEVYSKIFNAKTDKAKKDVEELQRSLKV